MSTDEYALPGVILRYFDLASAPYPGGAAEDIQDRRKAAPGGKLFFDRLLEFAEIDGPTLYPPTTPAGFRRLLHAIHSTTRIDRLKRDCFLYYLVRDRDAATRPTANGDMDVDSSSESSDGDSGASEFARRRCLPRTWRVFMDGYWLMDHGRWAEAVAALSDPAISELNFVPEIVSAITTLVSPPSESLRLVYELLDTRSLGSEVESNAALLAKAGVAGVSAAFAVVREQEQAAARAAGREAIWCWALGAPRTPCGKGRHTAQPRALKEMLHLAMHDEESAHLVGFLAHPPREVAPPARSLLHDLVTLRLVHAGKYEEILALDRELAGTDAASAADRQRRREMVREFIDILPETQRRILLGEDYKRGAATANGAVTVNGATDGDVDMGDSWVHIDAAPARATSSAAVVTSSAAPAASYADAAASPASPTAPLAAAAPSTPAPIAPQPVRLAQRALGIDGTPSRNGASSPFGGPPRFASPRPKGESTAAPSTTAGAPSTSSRQGSPTRLSSPPAPIRVPSPPRSVPRASPFVQAAPSSSKPARKPKRVINDDTPSLRRSTRQKSQPPEDDDRPARAMSRAPSEAPIPEDMPAPPAPPPSRPKRSTVKKTKKASEATDEVEQVTPKPRTKRTTRAASRASTVEPVDEQEEDNLKIPGAFGETPARRTRKAAKSTLDEPHEDETPAKRTRAKTTTSRKGNSTFRAPSEAPSEVSETPVRRTRRTAASERGSPTPSIASTVGSPKKRTTRTTRSRKAAAE